MLTPEKSGRFTPSRAGIINLWDYRDEEFVFVNGWLVLRGPNGSGKTKALEVLFPFVLDGRIEPRRLNPFASEDRTMKSNVLYRGQEVSYAYVWIEFCCRMDDSGAGEFVTIGVGLRAHKHDDRVRRHHFVVDGRVGVDFSLIDPDDRPLNRRDLMRELGAEHVYETPEEYRRAVDTRLFGLGPARYEQLLDLVLTLRKPQLAKDLNPVELSRTLQRGLRPLDEALLGEAAGSFDDMEAVARTLRGLVAADQATSAFLSIYSTYLRTHAKAAADALTSRRGAVDDSQKALSAATADIVDTKQKLEATIAEVAAASGEPARLRTHLDRLKSSAAYQSHEQLADLTRHVHDLAKAVDRASHHAAREQSSIARRQQELHAGESAVTDAMSQASLIGQELRDQAETAGVSWTIDDAQPNGFSQRVSARVIARRDDIRAVGEHARRLGQTERDHAKASQDATAAGEEATKAELAEAAAETTVTQKRLATREAMLAWHHQHGALLDELGAADAQAALTRTIEHVGEPGAATPRETLASLIAPGVTRLRESLAELGASRGPLVKQRDDVVAERDRIAAEHDDAPPPSPVRPADRRRRPGAALWQLVRFADGVPEQQQADVEAALHAAGLLDAWIHPDPALTAHALAAHEQDGYLFALPADRRPSGRTLADMLVAEDQPDVPVQAIQALLASVALLDTLAPGGSALAAISGEGQFAQGIQLGSFSKPKPEYIGATARAARRAARIQQCERQIAELSAQISAIDTRSEALRATLSNADTAAEMLPPLQPIHEALRDLDRAANTLRLRREHLDAARNRLDQAVAEHTTAVAALRRVTAERSLPADSLDTVNDAVRRFETVAVRLDEARRTLAKAQEAAREAKARHAEAVDNLDRAQEAIQDAILAHQEKLEALNTLSAAIGETDVQRILTDVADTENRIEQAETRLEQLREQATKAREALAGANTKVSAADSALQVATAEAHHESLGLRPFAHADLLSLLRCPKELRWPATAAESGTRQIDLEVIALHEAILAATKDLTPTEVSLKQSTTRLTTALTELQNQLPAAGLDHRPEFDHDDNVIVVRIADEQGLTPVAFFAERIARERQDQEQLLSDAERRILEDALLTQLARQIHHRTIEARDLVVRMDVQMRARRMSSGITVGVGWQLADDLDPEQREVCKLLDRDPARLGPSQLATMRRHFATRINAARSVSPEQPYRELLGQVLDYRQWRVFAFTLQRPGGTAEPLTRARHSQLSGGEQSVSLHLPLFAAANALLSSARADAPRMLGLDEAFAGVDDNGRGELMSLATQFDLDLFMTGYDLWATHPEVKGAAHYDLSHSAIEHTVSTVLLAWNGSVTTADFDGTLARALGSPETRRTTQDRPADALLMP